MSYERDRQQAINSVCKAFFGNGSNMSASDEVKLDYMINKFNLTVGDIPMMKTKIYDSVSEFHKMLVEEIKQYLETKEGQFVNVSITIPTIVASCIHEETITCIYINSIGKVLVNSNDSFCGSGTHGIEIYSINELVKIIEAL